MVVIYEKVSHFSRVSGGYGPPEFRKKVEIMKTKMLFVLAILVVTNVCFGQGTVIDDSFFSAAMDQDMWVDVYLPEGYDAADTETRYPVIYFLHGGGSNQNGYTNAITALNEEINSRIEPVIVVKPNGGPMNWWANSELSGMYEDYVAIDLIAYIDGEYNTIAEQAKRAIWGHSLGGYGAMAITLRHTNLFCASASHGGPLNFEANFIPDFQEVLNEHGGSGPFSPNTGGYSNYIFDTAKVFSPNLDNPPYNVDLPFDNDGVLIDSVWARWLDDDPGNIARPLDPADVPALYMDAGRDDFSYACTNAFKVILDSLNIESQYIDYDGGHMGQLPERYPFALAFIDSVFYQEMPRAYNTITNPSYVVPVTGEATITTDVLNILDHNITVTAKVHSEDPEFESPVDMFDDGAHMDGEALDGRYGGFFTPPEGEHYYNTEITVTDLDEVTENIRSDVALFTTVGPLEFFELSNNSEVVEAGAMYYFKVVLKNYSQTCEIPAVKGQLEIDESVAVITAHPSFAYGNIDPGEEKMNFGLIAMQISENMEIGSTLNFFLTITSNDVEYWQDEFSIEVTTDVDELNSDLPTGIVIHPAYPNPFNAGTRISMSLDQTTDMRIRVSNLLGREVAVLSDSKLNAGRHNFFWNANSQSNGTYFVVFETPEKTTQIQKIILLK
jgi:S-formylglutathione hydrolase FrmB